MLELNSRFPGGIMSAIIYWRVDVFTDELFGGNPLAVFLDADELTGEQMQKIALEMNLSETCFVSKSSDPAAQYRLRVFTTTMELPMAGHPEVGAHFVLATHGYYQLAEPKVTVFQELGGGVFPVNIHVEDGKVDRVTITLSRPHFHQTVPEVETVAEAIGLDKEHIASTKLPIQMVSTGLEQMIIPVASLEAIAAIEPVPRLLKRLAFKYRTSMFYLFTTETVDELSHAHSRLLTTGMTSSEDPATGSASGALGVYLIKNRLVDVFTTTYLVNEQGYEIGRPSKVYVEVDTENDIPTGVRVGGKVVPVAEGRLFI
jgi:trans-2,3-dihydro-3-hydroxyanthranilate isomerase